MRIFNLSFLFAAILCFSLSVRADDNAAQAAARAALMQKMQELDSATNNAAPPSAPAPETAPQPAAESPSAAQNVSPAETPSAPAPETSAPAQTPVPVPADMAPQTQPAPVETEATPMAAPVAAPTNEMSPETEEQAIIAARSAQVAPPATNASPAQPQAPMQTQRKTGFFSHVLHPFRRSNKPAVIEVQSQPQTVTTGKNNSGFAPIEPPPAPVSPEQEAQLQDLLQKYKADQITPEEYQTQRAAIIGNR